MLPTHLRARTGPALITAAALALGGLAGAAPASAVVDDGLVLKYNLTEAAGPSRKTVPGTAATARSAVTPRGWAAKASSSAEQTDMSACLATSCAGWTPSRSPQTSKSHPIRAPLISSGGWATTNGTGNGYLFTTGNSYRTSIASGNWATEQTTTADGSCQPTRAAKIHRP